MSPPFAARNVLRLCIKSIIKGYESQYNKAVFYIDIVRRGGLFNMRKAKLPGCIMHPGSFLFCRLAEQGLYQSRTGHDVGKSSGPERAAQALALVLAEQTPTMLRHRSSVSNGIWMAKS